ncbi:MAG: fatty acid desaturase [Myxococcota bacterium]|nr:fatty acid desaturase [Myxococcota bacterium]
MATQNLTDAHKEYDDGPLIWVNTLFLCGSPFLAAVLVPWYLMESGSHWALWVTAFVLWGFAGMGITVGYHRLVAHRSYQANGFWKFLFLIGGAAAIQNSAITWATSHRRHHQEVDTDNDPYNAKRGFWWSHIKWILHHDEQVEDFSSVPDLTNDRMIMWQHRYYHAIWMVMNIAVPAAIGLLIDRVWGMILIAGLLRVVLVHQGTFCINSVCHIIGTQPWSSKDTSRDSWISALFTFGEGYHNYHHTFAADYRNGLKWYHFDPGKWAIWTGEKLKMCSGLKRTTEQQRMKKRIQRVAEQYFAHLETMDAPAQASWRERLEGRLNEAEERLAAWSSRARKAARTKDEQLQAAMAEAEQAFRQAWAEFQALGRSARLAAA